MKSDATWRLEQSRDQTSLMLQTLLKSRDLFVNNRDLQILGGLESCFEPVGNLNLLIDVVKVGLDRMGTDVQVGGNLYVLGPGGHHSEYLALSSREVSCIDSLPKKAY